MKNLFLYYKFNDSSSDYLENLRDVYVFKNKKIIAVDKNTYSKEERLKLQKRSFIQPYYITQRIFKELILEAISGTIKIIDIIFYDELEEEEEYKELLNLLIKSEVDNVLEQVELITNEFETEIKSLEILDGNNRYSLTDTGILNLYNDYDGINKLLNNSLINKKILGLT